MNQQQRQLIASTRMSMDMLAVVMAWLSAFHLRFAFFETPKGVPPFLLYLKLVPFIVVIWAGVFSISGFYRRSQRRRSALLEALDIVPSCALATLAFVAFTYFYDEYRYSRITIFIFALLQPVFLIASRSVTRKLFRWYRRRSPERRVLVVTTKALNKEAAAAVVEMDLVMSNVVETVMLSENGDQSISGAPENWVALVTRLKVQAMVVALPYRLLGVMEGPLMGIADQVPDIRIIPDMTKFTRFASGIALVDGQPVININESPLAGAGRLVKRGMDVLGALTGLLLFGPVMLVVAILVPLTSRGPVLYRQERMGLDGRSFWILKFRSMPVNVEQKTGAVWARPGDNRATWFGSLLRSTSLDELPQFWNVLRGDMSLVGPRPERPVFVDQFRHQIPGYMLRHKVKAGITGWAQVNGWRGDTSLEKRIECDLFYIQHWSVWLDLKIILMTVFRGFLSKNAY
jgi:Undecaprenyl-phosphate glucose phosphotransferase